MSLEDRPSRRARSASGSSFSRGDQVDLVEHEDRRGGLRCPASSSMIALRCRRRRRASASTSSTTRSASSAPAQAAATMARSSRRARREDAGRVDKTICASPFDARCRARGVRVVCTLGETIDDLACRPAVEQRRLAGIGRADERDKAAARVPGSRCMFAVMRASSPSAGERRRRGCVSAARFERAASRVGGAFEPRPCDRSTVTVKVRLVRRAFGGDGLVESAAAGRAPAPIPASAVLGSRGGAAERASCQRAPTSARRNRAPPAGRRRDRARRSPPRRHRRARWDCRARRRRPRPRDTHELRAEPDRLRPPRPALRAAPDAVWRRVSSPSASFGKTAPQQLGDDRGRARGRRGIRAVRSRARMPRAAHARSDGSAPRSAAPDWRNRDRALRRAPRGACARFVHQWMP